MPGWLLGQWAQCRMRWDDVSISILFTACLKAFWNCRDDTKVLQSKPITAPYSSWP